MILFLVCLIGAGINLSVGQDTPTTTCKIATDVKSALYILEVGFDPFELDDAVLLASLRSHLLGIFTNSQSEINGADERKLVTWASMLGMIDAGKLGWAALHAVSDKNGAKSEAFWTTENPNYMDELRIAFEEVALSVMGDDSKAYLSTFFADYSDEEVLTFVCNRGSWSTDGRKAPVFDDGCYDSDAASDLVKFSTTVTGGRWQCMDHCRTQKTLYIIYNVNTDLCECVDRLTAGTPNTNTVVTCTTKLVYRTGNGAPIMNFEDALKFAPESLGFEPIADNDVVDVKKVNVLDVDGSGESALHFVALMKYAIALFKVVEDSSTKALSHSLVDWRRWDAAACGNTAPLNEHCMKQVFPEDSRRKLFPGLGNLKYKEALAFEIFPMFVEYSAAMQLNTTLPEEEFIDFQSEPYIKTGNPMVYPGGKWFDHILVTHKDVVEVDMSSMIRIENGRFIQLYTAVGSTFFGNYLSAKINSFPIALDHRTAGRETYLFIATHRETVDSVTQKVTLKESSVTLYSAVENEIEITDFAVYGRISTAAEFKVAGFFVTDVLYVKTVWPLLVILDSTNQNLDANGRPTNTQIKVYRIQSFVQLVLVDAVIIDNFKYTKVSHVKHDGKHKLILEGNINGEYIAKYLEMSVKGKLSTQVSDLTLPDDVKTPATGGILSFFSYGRLKNNLVVPVLSDTNIHILSYDGTDLQTTALTDRDSQAIKCFEHKEMEVCVLGRKEKSDSVINFELTRITPHSKMNVLDNDVVYTALDALKSRIENMYSVITASYTEFSNKQSNYLMHTGSVVPTGSSWNLATLTASQLTVPANSLDDSTSVTMKIVNTQGVETVHTNMKSKLNILMDTVETQAYLVGNKTTEFQTKYDSDALSLSETTLQTISNTNIDKVTAHRIRSTETSLVVDQLKASDGTVMTLKDLSDKTFMQNNPQPLLGNKTFNKGLKVNNLITATLSDAEDTVAPGTCLVKNLDVTIDVGQTFNSGFTATSLLVEGTASIIDSQGSTIVKEDLEPHIDRTVGLPGFFSFANDVSAVGLDATVNDFPLDSAQVPNIALKAQANTIAGDLTVNLGSSAATGSSLLLKNTALLNNVDILDVKNNAVRTSCVGCTDCSANCANTILQVHSPVTFNGSLSATSATVTELNDIPWTDYITKSEFGNPITLAGTKTFTGVNVNILQADTFDGLTPDQLLTTNSHQDIAQSMTFSKATTYKSIDTPSSNPCVPVDGRDLCQVFKSDLAAINAQESWITSNTIDTDLEFTNLKILEGSDLRFDGTVNGMTVGDIVDKIVTDESKSFAITGTKTISSPASLADVTSGDGSNNVNIEYNNVITTINDYVNTVTTTEMSGTKRFTNAVSIEDIFTVGDTQINDLSVAHLLHCFVDKGDHLSEPIHIRHPISFNKVSLPRITLERNSALSTYGIVPTDAASGPQVIQFCSIPLPNGDNLDDQDPSNDAYFLPIVQQYLLQFGVTLTIDPDYYLHAMFTCVLKTDEHVATLTNDERLAKIKILLNEQYGIPMTRLNSKTGIELLALIARKPLVNEKDPSSDLALLDGDNQFCKPATNCVQDFEGGIDAAKITTNSNIMMLDGDTVHGIDIDVLDEQRVELVGHNTIGGVLTFSSLSLKPTDGTYTVGRLDIDTGSNGFVSSNDFAGKFVRTDLTSDQTVTGAVNFQGQITATNIDATTFNINGVTYDVSATDDISHDLDQDVTFNNLIFNSDITLKNKVSLTGTLSDVTLSEFHDAIAVGADIPVTVDGSVTATIKGTDRTNLGISGLKTFTNDFTVDNVIATKDDVGLYPQFTYLSCKRLDMQTGKLVGSTLSEYFGITEVQCFDKCRDEMCYGLSYRPASDQQSHCIIYDSISSIDPSNTVYHSYLYECCYQLKVTSSSSPEMYLSVDSSDNLAVSSTDKDLWCLVGQNLVHKKTDKAVINSGGQLALAAIPKTLVVGDPNPAYELFNYVSENGMSFKIECLGTPNTFLKANDDGTTTLDSTGSSWDASIVGIAFTELENDVIKPRVLTVNTAQDVTGSFIVRGDLGVENVEIHSDNLAALTYDTVTATYSYDAASSTHQIATPYTVTGSGITVTNLNSNSYNDDIADFVRLDSASEVTLQGNTQFNADITSTHSDGITVGGTVASYDLADFNTNVARTYATSLTFTQANTFAVNPNDGQTYDLTGTSLTSSVDMSLTNSQIAGVNKIDLVDLRSKTILTDETSAVTINGKVIFNKVVVNGGHFTMGDSRLNGHDIGIVDDLILRSDSSVDFSNHAIDSMIVNQPLTISGQDVFGHNSEKFLDVLYKDGDQTVTEDFTMNGAVSAGQTVTTTTFNGYEPLQSMIQLNAVVNIDSKFDFKQTLNLNSVDVTGTINGFDFLAKFRDSVATLAGDNTITQKWTIHPAFFDGDILGTQPTNNMYINDQRVSDLNKAAGIFDQLHAVKVSAQAEANVLCEFVSDLQESYLSNQEIIHYELVKTETFAGATFSSSKLVNTPDNSKYFLFVLNGRDLELYYVRPSTGVLDKLFNVQLTIGLADGFLPRIDHVVDVSSSSSTNYRYVVFVSTGKPSSGVEMYYADINTAVTSVNIISVGALSNALAVSDFSLSSVLVYKQDAGVVGLSVINIADLVTCSGTGDCSAVTTAETLSACTAEDPEICQVDSVTDAVQVGLKTRLLPTGHRMVAFNQKIASLNQDVVRVLLFEKSVQGAYILSKNIIESSSTLDFSISILDAKVFLILSGSKLEMREVHVQTGTLEDKDLSMLDRGTYTNIVDGKDFGSENGILVVKNGMKFVDLKYNGVNGLKTYSTLDVPHSILSVSCTDVVDSTSGLVVYMKAFLGRDTITILKADLANPVKYVQFECVQPEVPVGFTSP